MRLRTAIRIVAVALLAGCKETPVDPGPVLPDQVDGIPPNWTGSIGTSNFYRIGLYRPHRHGGQFSAYLDGQPNFTSEIAFIQQRIRADDYRGKRVRFSAWVEAQDLIGPIAGLWMRVDGPGVVSGYDNMSNRAESGNTTWHEVSIVLDVPDDAIGFVIGAMLQGGGPLGSGFLLVDDMKLEVVATSVPSTNKYVTPVLNGIDPAVTIAAYANAATSPTNLDFEKIP